jgi:hypothetical protein
MVWGFICVSRKFASTSAQMMAGKSTAEGVTLQVR